ncbi:MAG TPA: hypothetical protein VF523_15700, partial [Burkholderiales bacterium]
LTGRYAADAEPASDEADGLVARMLSGELTAAELLARYSRLLHRRFGTFAEVAKRTGLDPRTTRKYIEGKGKEER